MILPKMTQTSPFSYSSLLDGGITDKPGGIGYTENMFKSGKYIKSRGGLTLVDAENNFINQGEDKVFEITDAVYISDGQHYRVAYEGGHKSLLNYYFRFKLINTSGETKSAGFVHFSGENPVKEPQSVVVFTAPPIKAAGLFAFIRVKTYSNKEFFIYEFSGEDDEWINIPIDEAYVPTYYLNGRGEHYADSGAILPDPEYNEPINILNGTFKCYYNTDGFSNGFYIPIKIPETAPDDYFNCELTISLGQTLKFSMDGRTSVSNYVEYGEKQLFVTYDRTTGRFAFGSIPIGYIPNKFSILENNIKVTIKSRYLMETDDIVYAKHAHWHNFTSDGARLCLGGSDRNPAKVLVSQIDNPLYFAKNSAITVGHPSHAITAITSQHKNLIVFKENGVYAVSGRPKSPSVMPLHSNVGLKNKKLMAKCENHIIWGYGKRVYMLASSGASSRYGIDVISTNVNDMLEEMGDMSLCCADKDKAVVFCSGGDAIVFKMPELGSRDYEPQLYIWKFPEETFFYDAVSDGDNIALVLKANTQTARYYTAVLSDVNFDTYINAEEVIKTCGIDYKLHINDVIDSHNQKTCFIDKAYFELSAEKDVVVGFSNKNGDTLKIININMLRDKGRVKTVKILPFLRAGSLCIDFSSDGPVNLGPISLEGRILRG